MPNLSTLKLKIKSSSNPDFIYQKSINYSFAFRLSYKNFNLINNISFKNFITSKFNLNEHEYRSLIIDVETKFNQILAQKQEKEEQIINITKRITELKEEKIKLKKLYITDREKYKTNRISINKLTRIIFKLTQKLNYINSHLADDIVFGGKNLLKQLSFLSNDKSNNLDLINSKLTEYKQKRILPFFIVGEANQHGNRQLDFKKLSQNKVILKYAKDKIDIEFYEYKNKKKILKQLEEAAIENKLPITCRLDNNYISLSYDLDKLNGILIDEKSRKEEVNLINKQNISKENKSLLIKEIYCKYYLLREKQVICNKYENRIASVDLNPENIGFSIIEYNKENKNYKVIYAVNYNLRELNINLKLKSSDPERIYQNNKRKHEIIQIWNQIFRICVHYKCGYFAHEELEFDRNKKGKEKNSNSREGNRKINNLWHRVLTNNLIKKYCIINGIIEKEVLPMYSSFVGNMLNEYIDPINSSIEIGRRYFSKEIGEGYYPLFETGTIYNAMRTLNKEKEVCGIKDCKGWKDSYYVANSLKFRWRRTLEDCSEEQYKKWSMSTIRSKVDVVRFTT